MNFLVLCPPQLADFQKSAQLWLENLKRNPCLEAQKFFSFFAENKSITAFATSGSSGGTPKLVIHTEKSLIHSALIVNEHLNTTKNDRWIRVLPSFHVGGFMIGVRANLLGIDVHEVTGKWNPHEFSRQARESRASLCSLVPTQVFDLVRENLFCPPDLRAIVVGGGRLENSVAQKARSLGWPVVASYGMTEAASQIATGHASEPWDSQNIPIIKGWTTLLSDAGRLSLRGNALFSGYLKPCQGSIGDWIFDQSCFDSEGFFVTNDCVSIENNNISFLCRADRLVKIYGELVDLDAIENWFSAQLQQLCRANNPCLVLAQTDERRGKILVLVCENPTAPSNQTENHSELENGSDLEKILPSLKEKWNSQSASFQSIAEIRLLPEFPRSALGKILRSEIL